jgi:hypothetical protein
VPNQAFAAPPPHHDGCRAMPSMCRPTNRPLTVALPSLPYLIAFITQQIDVRTELLRYFTIVNPALN